MFSNNKGSNMQHQKSILYYIFCIIKKSAKSQALLLPNHNAVLFLYSEIDN